MRLAAVRTTHRGIADVGAPAIRRLIGAITAGVKKTAVLSGSVVVIEYEPIAVADAGLY